MKRLSFRRLCEVKAHKRLKHFCSDSHGLSYLYYCEDCSGLRYVRHSNQAPKIETLEVVASKIYELAPKLEKMLKDESKPLSQLLQTKDAISRNPISLPLKERIVSECVKEGKDRNSVFKALDFLLDLGMKHGISVNGVPYLVELGRYKAIVRLTDVYGDPPFVRTVFNCPGCGTEYYADDMVAHESYYCQDCLTWITYDGLEIKPTVPTSNYTNLYGHLLEELTGNPIREATVKIRGKTTLTDEAGHFSLDYLPQGKYELEISVRNFKVSIPFKANDYYISKNLLFTVCSECGKPYIKFNGEVGKFRCLSCSTEHLYRNGSIYRLKSDEAFCYDFRDNRVYYWTLKCPLCETELELDFSQGSWFCSKCRMYRRPEHDFRFFRTILPCGHEGRFNIRYLTNNIPLKCGMCGNESSLPSHVRSAWGNAPFDLIDNFLVNSEYFVRRNPWVVPLIVLLPPIGISLALNTRRD